MDEGQVPGAAVGQLYVPQQQQPQQPQQQYQYQAPASQLTPAMMMMPPTAVAPDAGPKFHWPFGFAGGAQSGPPGALHGAGGEEGGMMDVARPTVTPTTPAMMLGVARAAAVPVPFMSAQVLPMAPQHQHQQQVQQRPQPLQPPQPRQQHATGGGARRGAGHHHHHPPILPRHDVAILPKPTPGAVGAAASAYQQHQQARQSQPPLLQPRPVVKAEAEAEEGGGGEGKGGGASASAGGGSSSASGSGGGNGGGGKRGPQSESAWSALEEDGMTEERKKRLRNEREQRRAHLITDQIESLKQVLENGKYPLRSTSKFDILAGCDEYIQHLKQRRSCLDMELRLGHAAVTAAAAAAAATTQQAQERQQGGGEARGGGGGRMGGANGSSWPSSNGNGNGGGGGGGGNAGGGEESSSSLSSEDGEQREMVLDFSEIFRSSHLPMAVVSIDGRILQCNDEFSRVTDITNDKLSGVTLFSLAAPEALEELFISIARLLSTAALDEANPAFFATAAARAAPLAHPGYEGASILMSLVRDDERRARAFHCCIVSPHPSGGSAAYGSGGAMAAARATVAAYPEGTM